MTLLLIAAILGADITLSQCLMDDQPDDAALSVALTEAIPGGTVRLGPGILILQRPIAEFRGVTGEPCRRLDVTITGDGTVIRGIGAAHDVMQLNAVSHITLENMVVESESSPGVNGVSLTNGTHDVLCDRVTVRNMPFVTNLSSFGGGKSFTVQQGTSPDRCSAIFRDCSAVGCPVGFGVDAAPDKGVPGSVVIDGCEVRDCLVGVALSFAAHTAPTDGFSVEVVGCRFLDTKRALIAARTPDVRFCWNSMNVVRFPDWTDPYDRLFPAVFSVRDAQRVSISGNTVIYRPDRELWDAPGADVTGNIVRR